MGSSFMPKLTAALLHSYSEAALRNANELLVEASLLRSHGHEARAYFLAVACIEEAGKALLAFDAQKRNLSDTAVCAKLKRVMESHERKINYVLGIWAMSSPDPHEAMKVALDLILQLKRGREPSMYSDLRTNPDRVHTPREVVHANAARDSIRLAKDALAYSHRHVSEKTPNKFTLAQDKLFTMKQDKFQDMLNTEGFWLYYISRMKVGDEDIAEAVLAYERDHLRTGAPFSRER